MSQPLRRNPERLAWTVLFASFLVFVVLLIAIPLAIRAYLFQATTGQKVTVEVIRGTALVRPFAGARDVEASTQPELAEGDTVRTTEGSEAVIWLFDGSNVHLWPNSSVRLDRLQRSRFNSLKVDVAISQRSGSVRYEVAPLTTTERSFSVLFPPGSSILREGSYSVWVQQDRTEISARLGSATVSANDRAVELLSGERTVVQTGQSPAAPLPATRNIVTNGDFNRGLEGWQVGNRALEDNVPGQVSLSIEDGRHIAIFERRNSNRHGETFIHQPLEIDVRDFQSLRLSLSVKVLRQTLPGGGWLGSEYPAMVLVRYRDAFGNENTWYRGYYTQNNEGRPVTSGQQVTAGLWRSETIDLYSPQHVYPKPAYLLWIEVQGSGWEYQSAVTDLQITAK